MICTNIMSELQSTFDFNQSSANKFRSANDMQYAFSYFYFLRESRRTVQLDEIFELIDTDHSGAWSDREIRLFLSKINLPPVLLEDLTRFEQNAKLCGKKAKFNTESYFDPEMPLVTLELISNCPTLVDLVLSWKSSGETKHKSMLMDDSEIDFVMLDGNVSHVISKLDRIRKNDKKFICINDNIESGSDYLTVRNLLIDFYLTVLPQPSPFELPNNYRNRFANLADYVKWKRKQRILLILCLSIIVLLLLIIFANRLPLPLRLRRLLKKL